MIMVVAAGQHHLLSKSLWRKKSVDVKHINIKQAVRTAAAAAADQTGPTVLTISINLGVKCFLCEGISVSVFDKWFQFSSCFQCHSPSDAATAAAAAAVAAALKNLTQLTATAKISSSC